MKIENLGWLDLLRIGLEDFCRKKIFFFNKNKNKIKRRDFEEIGKEIEI